MFLITFETLKNDLEYILSQYKNETDIVLQKDLIDFAHCIQNYNDDILTRSYIEFITYAVCKDQKITVKYLQHFIDNCYLA